MPRGPGGGSEPCGCKGGCGRKLTMFQMAQYLALGGFSSGGSATPADQARLIRAVATGYAESSGYEQACNFNTNGTFDRGFMQINSIHGYGASSYEAQACATQAWTIYKNAGHNFSPWSTWSQGKALLYIPAATIAVNQLTKGDPGVAIPSGGKGDPGIFSGSAGGDRCIHSVHIGLFFGHGPSVCMDAVLGGLKVVGGSIILGVSGLAVLYLIARDVPGAAEASGAVRKATGTALNPARAAQRTYRTRRAPARAPARIAASAPSAEERETIRRERERQRTRQAFLTARAREAGVASAHRYRSKAEQQDVVGHARAAAARARALKARKPEYYERTPARKGVYGRIPESR